MLLFVALSVALLATYGSASPVVTIPLTKLQQSGDYVKISPDGARARAASLKDRATGAPTTVPATSLAYVQYTTRVGIGHPPIYYNLVVDTGSSLTFCGTGTPYVRTSTSIPTGQQMSDTFGMGNFTGLEYRDQVTLAPNLVINNQSINDATSSSGFQGVDGILGLGPVNLTMHTVINHPNATIPTVMDNLVSRGLIKNKILGIHFAPSTSQNDTNGALTFGGVDSSLFKGELAYVPLTNTYPASKYWGINITSSTYGNDHTVIRTPVAGIIDSGSTQVLLSDDTFELYMNAIPGAKWDSDIGLLEIPTQSVQSLQPLHFVIYGQTFTMDAAAQLVPKDQSEAWGGVTGKRYGVIGKLGFDGQGGFDFILGQAFMVKYYAVFDADMHRIGFAKTKS